MSSTLKPKVKLRLAFNSYNQCSFPDCTQRLTADPTAGDEGVIIGEAAHIRGEKPGAARYDPDFPENQVNGYDNLIYLCPDHHTLIDKQPNTYTIEMLHQWKDDHIRLMRERTEDALPDVSFSELEIVTKALVRSVPATATDLNLTPPEEKIQKNELTEYSRFLISMGLAKSNEVKSFIQEFTTIYSGFDETLVAGFREQYDALTAEGLKGDALFDEMYRFSCNGSADPVIHAAGLSVLSHLFEICEVFKK